MIFQIIIQLIAFVFIVAIEVTDFVIEKKDRNLKTHGFGDKAQTTKSLA